MHPHTERCQVNDKELPLSDFGVQRPIELVEKELTDTVYYTREVSDAAASKKIPRAGKTRTTDAW
jgi:hypothetical protein